MKKPNRQLVPAPPTSAPLAPAVIDDDFIKSRILTVRGVQVLLDRDLAELYELNRKYHTEECCPDHRCLHGLPFNPESGDCQQEYQEKAVDYLAKRVSRSESRVAADAVHQRDYQIVHVALLNGQLPHKCSINH